LSIDVNVQKNAEDSLARQIDQTRKVQDKNTKSKFETFKAPSGSVTMVDPTNGQIRAMASYPTYDPSAFVGGISTQAYQELTAQDSGFPLNNWATQGQYAPGSTFKMVSALAGLKSGMITTNSTFNDTGSLKVSDVVFNNAAKQVNGIITLPKAIEVSSDTYFYNIGSKLWSLQYKKDPKGDAIQDTAREFGFGKKLV
jgi:penicillin-binding protein 2